jgi:SanA protein
MQKKKIFKNVLVVLFTGIILSVITVFYSNQVVISSANGKTFNSTDSLPEYKAGLLLGTSKYTGGNRLNAYFVNRITAAVELMKAEKIKYIIISGDNGLSTYDEPTEMKNELIKNGIDSTRIFLDYAGFRTFDSMVRVKEIFGQNTIIVISQKFHNERAIYIAQKLMIDAVGYNAKDVDKYFGFKTAIREKFARVKVILDFITGAEPRFLGDKIILP